jgi:hypothetical protein
MIRAVVAVMVNLPMSAQFDGAQHSIVKASHLSIGIHDDALRELRGIADKPDIPL